MASGVRYKFHFIFVLFGQHRLTLKYFFVNFDQKSSLHFTLGLLVSSLSYYCKISLPTLDWTLVSPVTEPALRDRSTVKTKDRERVLNTKYYFFSRKPRFSSYENMASILKAKRIHKAFGTFSASPRRTDF